MNASQLVELVFNYMGAFTASTRPAALLCGNDMIAIATLKALYRLSLNVADDVAIVSYDGIDMAELITPSLTTLHQPQEQIASDVVDLMISRIQKGARLQRSI
ncbi:substrate-binding domain-containing protein [Coraliomargarita sp. SDUM461004]|uniref:Substrate-binding domain-containing protein n=1 Tax=Thalassobacterium sedimentorum TaxID=3041258 RepID=A0ABU1AFP6_9BACT|nr:substrate-binding domain-containing protein [Coraliomargarita sp. SDUM461004]MDQ8192948.1 substrate-binding domain-containing protein [Coraliomargarita sp. SDUM461004]